MKSISSISVLCLLLLTACSPKISTSITKTYPALDYREEVVVIGLDDPMPADAEQIGTVKIGDSGFSTDCGWDIVIEKATAEARKAGGNAIKIIKHSPPNALGSTCHRITALILKVSLLKIRNIPTKP